MNSYMWIRRARGPVILITFGITALLDQANILSYGRSWPLYLLVLGVMQLAERAALSQAQNPPLPPYGVPPTPYGAATQSTAPPTTALSISPSPLDREEK